MTTGAVSCTGPDGTPQTSGLAQINGFTKDFHNQFVEQVYGGDLNGNFWRLDVSDPNPANWTVDQLRRARRSGGQRAAGDDRAADRDRPQQRRRPLGVRRHGTAARPVRPHHAVPGAAADDVRDPRRLADHAAARCEPADRPRATADRRPGGRASSSRRRTANGWYQDLPTGASAERIVFDVEADPTPSPTSARRCRADPCLIVAARQHLCARVHDGRVADQRPDQRLVLPRRQGRRRHAGRRPDRSGDGRAHARRLAHAGDSASTKPVKFKNPKSSVAGIASRGVCWAGSDTDGSAQRQAAPAADRRERSGGEAAPPLHFRTAMPRFGAAMRDSRPSAHRRMLAQRVRRHHLAQKRMRRRDPQPLDAARSRCRIASPRPSSIVTTLAVLGDAIGGPHARRVHVVGADRPYARSRAFAAARSLSTPRRAAPRAIAAIVGSVAQSRHRKESPRRAHPLSRRHRSARSRVAEPRPRRPRLDAACRPSTTRSPLARFGEALDDETLARVSGRSRRRGHPPRQARSPLSAGGACRASRRHRSRLGRRRRRGRGRGDASSSRERRSSPRRSRRRSRRCTSFPAHDLGRNIRFYVTLEFDFRIEGAGTPAPRRPRRRSRADPFAGAGTEPLAR